MLGAFTLTIYLVLTPALRNVHYYRHFIDCETGRGRLRRPNVLLLSSIAKRCISAQRWALFFFLPMRLILAPVRAPGCKELRHFHWPCGLAGVRTQSSFPDHNILWPCVHHALTPLSSCMYSVDRAEGRGREQKHPQAENRLQWSQVL